MKKFFLFSLLFFVSQFNFGQVTLSDLSLHGGSNTDGGTALATDSEGNIFSTGYFKDTIDFDGQINGNELYSMGNEDIFITKHNAAGLLVWAKRVGGAYQERSSSITVDSDDNILLTGQLYHLYNVDFDPGPDSSFISGMSLFILKLDNEGNFIFVRNFPLTFGLDPSDARSIATDSQNSILLTGNYGRRIDLDPGPGQHLTDNPVTQSYFIVKLDVNGNYLWSADHDYPTYWSPNTVMATQNDTVLVAGYDGDGGYIIKYGPDGNHFSTSRVGMCGVTAMQIDHNRDIILTGFPVGTSDFDPGPGVCNLSGSAFVSKYSPNVEFRWAKAWPAGIQEGKSLTVDPQNNIYVSSTFYGLTDFDSDSSSSFMLSGEPLGDAYIMKLGASGDFFWAKEISGDTLTFEQLTRIHYSNNSILGIGHLQGTYAYLQGQQQVQLVSNDGSMDVFFLRLKERGVYGNVFRDMDTNCIRNAEEHGLPHARIVINPGNIVAESNYHGRWHVDQLPLGDYTATIDTLNLNLGSLCSASHSFSVVNPDSLIQAPDFGAQSLNSCMLPISSVVMPIIRRCFENQVIYIQACNSYYATAYSNAPWSEVQLDENFIFQSSSIPAINLGNNKYRFQHSALLPGECTNFTIQVQVSCNALPSQTLCVESVLKPIYTCALDTVPNPFPADVQPCTSAWDHSSLSVFSSCDGDSIRFEIKNTGTGAMDCFAPVRRYLDSVLVEKDSVKLLQNESKFYVFAADGRTWRVEANQHPLHPGNSLPSASLEACGSQTPDNWTPGLISIFPEDDADDYKAIYCGPVTGSYDPNDKRGFPLGVTENKLIPANQQIDYIVRFQNTGTDTAFTVVVRDTLDENFNIFTLRPGAASTPYTFRMYGPRVLEWTFWNILLPDSTTNEPASHGFLTYTVQQNPNLPEGTVLRNEADIYFDFNDPIITNETQHQVSYFISQFISLTELETSSEIIRLFPNPAKEEVTLLFDSPNEFSYRLRNLSGQKLLEKQKLSGIETKLDLSSFSKGVYFIEVDVNGKTEIFKLILD
ncbi:MAG: conserved repeat domain protein [Crocinitomicaceae bacterium]|jgi:uncharacterized repeat protein (TIGR01451 family)|nr:conserved repeat domain protein [Crocinitomicaceae bacterium]